MPPGGPVLRVVLWEVGGPVLLDSDTAAFSVICYSRVSG